MITDAAGAASSSHEANGTARGALLIAGVDEVGRGALFGPVVAAAVLVPNSQLQALTTMGVKDSKQLSERQRQMLYPQILARAVDCKVGLASVDEIQQLNILQASLLAMARAVERLNRLPEQCLVDGNCPIPGLQLPQETMVGGDQRHSAIAAASIIAKVWRDALMVRLDRRYPGYDLAANKGYGTAKHRAGLHRQGLSRYHRRAFKACREAALASADPRHDTGPPLGPYELL